MKETISHKTASVPVQAKDAASRGTKLAPPGVTQLAAYQTMANNSAQVAQLSACQQAANKKTAQRQPNNTGLPDNLKTGIEALSGHSLNNVRVHYNSPKPARINAHAYAQGNDIHLATGQEKHLPHEAWHTVQQKQGRVQPTHTVGGVNINDNKSLEREADTMGGKALQLKAEQKSGHGNGCGAGLVAQPVAQPKAVAQRVCGVPGCTDPNCHDPNNHKISNFRELRNVQIYHAQRDQSDIGTGSGTSKKTRDYVQDPNSFYPEEVSLSYSNQDGTYSGGSSYEQPPRTTGMKPDAGHIFGNQYGGSGKDTANIFAQEPKHNRGNSYQGNRTFEKWRQKENDIRAGLKKGDKLGVTAKLYKKKRKKKWVPPSDDWAKAFMERYGPRKDDDDQNMGGGGITT